MKAEPRMPIRDADLRDAVLEHEVRPGDPLWSRLAELQRRRDGERKQSRERAREERR